MIGGYLGQLTAHDVVQCIQIMFSLLSILSCCAKSEMQTLLHSCRRAFFEEAQPCISQKRHVATRACLKAHFEIEYVYYDTIFKMIMSVGLGPGGGFRVWDWFGV